VTFCNNNYTEKPPTDQKTKMTYILKHTTVLQTYFGTLQEPHIHEITISVRKKASLYWII